ncbi:DUF4097 family beta strand repeat-containing protein [Micromonospora sp. WMMD1102]|uniref:DUF4097 family beta strand repeat-containing protein n=1 Tax=Micromonospora sp. WMMD1102 TaxID=3016105 RepID=UPI0024159653|nr:DUF4097 family beta strand repeat-containing protein [Micromonospora sp. WMMD1102]MDG4789241.1 DUF4097 family beta strand repeat-containing protein [Micromonospora sp. WMMD1102]
MLVSRTTALTGGLALAALIALAGCDGLAEQRLTYDRTEDVKITEIEVLPGSGNVVVRTGAVQNVRIERVVQYRGPQPDDSTYRIEGTKLILDTDCGKHCGVSYDILAPAGVALRGENGSGDVNLTALTEVDIKVGSGDITVTDVDGPVRVETGSGDIRLTRLPGTVSARAGSGSVEGRSLGAGKVDAQTGSGDISLTLAAPGPVQANASSGSIDLTVPAGGYQVRTHADSGNTDVKVPNDPAAKAVLDLQTGSGDITVRSS